MNTKHRSKLVGVGALAVLMVLATAAPAPAKPLTEQAATFVGRAVPVFEEALAAIDALEEPRALSANVTRLLRIATKELHALRSHPMILVETEGNALPKARTISVRLGITCLAG